MVILKGEGCGVVMGKLLNIICIFVSGPKNKVIALFAQILPLNYS